MTQENGFTPMSVPVIVREECMEAFNRYFAMLGRELRYQNGFDCQGLWVEVEVEKELGLKQKQDIENLVPGDPRPPRVLSCWLWGFRLGYLYL